MRSVSVFSIGLILFYGAIAISQIWFEIMSAENFVKVTVTMAIVLVVTVVAALIKKEYLDEKQARKDGFID